MKTLASLCLLVGFAPLAFADVLGTITPTTQNPSFTSGDLRINIGFEAFNNIGATIGQDSVSVPVDSQGHFAIPQAFVDKMNSQNAFAINTGASITNKREAGSVDELFSSSGSTSLGSLTNLVDMNIWNQTKVKISTPKGESFASYVNSVLRLHGNLLAKRYLLKQPLAKTVTWEIDMGNPQIQRNCYTKSQGSPIVRDFAISFDNNSSTAQAVIPAEEVILSASNAGCVQGSRAATLVGGEVSLILMDSVTKQVVGGITLVGIDQDAPVGASNTFDIKLKDATALKVDGFVR